MSDSTHPSEPIRPAVVDLATSEQPAAELHAALSQWGFVAVRNSAIDESLRAAAFASAKTFFNLSEADKARDAYTDTEANFGYQGLQTEALDPGIAADLKEAFTMRNLNSLFQPAENVGNFHSKASSKSAANDWADTPFAATATRLYNACSDTAMHLMRLIAQALGVAEDRFTRHHSGENTTLRYLHYPSAPSNRANFASEQKKMPQLGAGAHTDYGTITLLFSDGVAGLQLFDVSNARATGGTRPPSDGVWRDVEVADGDVLVNTGDLMALWSNGIYPSTLHRVQPRTGKPDRYSMAFFVDPDSSTLVAPLPSCINPKSSNAHPTTANAVVAGEHIQARIEASQRTLA